MKINKIIFKIVAGLRSFKQMETNKLKGERMPKDCEAQLQKIENERRQNYSAKDCSLMLIKLKEIQEQLAFARFKYFIFPSILIGKSFNKYLKKMPDVTEYDLLGQFDYKM